MPDCLHCHKPFKLAYKSLAQKYCSNDCKYGARRTIPGFKCKTCGKRVKKPRTAKQRFCSITCKVISLKAPAPPVETLVQALLQHRYKNLPNWFKLSEVLDCDIRTVQRWSKELNLLDESGNGPVVDGALIPCEYAQPRPVNQHLVSKEHLTKRLLRKREVDEATNCWIWVGGWNQKGYGYLTLPRPYNTKHTLVSSVAAYIWFDIPINTEIYVFHTCNVRACFNPDHLKICHNRHEFAKLCGKYKRHSRGEKNGRCTIKLETALDIRDALKLGDETQKQIAIRLEVDSYIVHQIARKVTWKHIWKMKHEYEEA